MDMSIKSSPCKVCDEDPDGLQLQAEVEHLRQHLTERDSHIVAIEGEYLKCTDRANDLEEQLNTWREKYERLYDSHKRVQKLNQVLEDKLLQMVDKMKSEKSQLTKDIATLSVRLAESKHNYSMLQKENERYKNDMNLAIQLLQCKPDNFVSHKLDNLPVDTQARVSQYVMSKTSKPCSSSQSKNGNDIENFDTSEYEFNISASLMTKILEDSIQDTMTKHCDTCTCNRSQNKPFCYNESYYSVSSQTILSGEQKNSLCINCNAEINCAHSNLSIRSNSPHVIKLLNDKSTTHNLMSPMYILPQQGDSQNDNHIPIVGKPKIDPKDITSVKDYEKNLEPYELTDAKTKVDVMKCHRNSEFDVEPAIHHKLCDHTKTPISSKKSSVISAGNDDVLTTQSKIKIKETKSITENKSLDDTTIRKNSQSSMGAMSRTSSVAKSTVSTHKSNTQVGPGPRFCHLRMQAGSKNILLDNAEPDVPPVLYKRQSKCNENSMYKDLSDDIDNFIHLDRNHLSIKEDFKNDNVVVESTLVDVHVDNNNKESNINNKSGTINPVLLNVSSSPLQPLKTHNFSNSSEQNNNNKSQSSQHNASEIDNLLNDFNADHIQNNNNDTQEVSTQQNLTPTDNHDVKIFNFDRYEQNRISAGQQKQPLKKIEMSQFNSIENTKISKDLSPIGEVLNDKKGEGTKSTLLPVVNVYPNLTQTHLKVNEHKKVFTNEHSVSSLSSDDSAAMLQKQQLLRVAEWVEKNLEQQNNFNEPLEDDVNFNNRTNRRDSKLSRLTETLNELALNMPHPVSKYSKLYSREGHSAWLHNNSIPTHEKVKHSDPKPKISCNVVKETIFPVESGGATTEICKDKKNKSSTGNYDVNKELLSALQTKNEKELTREDLARMEYNVKKFLLSGPHWVNPAAVGRSRRTSSKTETDV